MLPHTGRVLLKPRLDTIEDSLLHHLAKNLPAQGTLLPFNKTTENHQIQHFWFPSGTVLFLGDYFFLSSSVEGDFTSLDTSTLLPFSHKRIHALAWMQGAAQLQVQTHQSFNEGEEKIRHPQRKVSTSQESNR